jgi:hypothetical protein
MKQQSPPMSIYIRRCNNHLKTQPPLQQHSTYVDVANNNNSNIINKQLISTAIGNIISIGNSNGNGNNINITTYYHQKRKIKNDQLYQH